MKTLVITLPFVVLFAHLSGYMSSSQCTEGMIEESVNLSKDLKDGMIQLNCTVSELTESVDFIFPNNIGYAYCIAPTSLTTETSQHCNCECNSTSTCECTISQNIDTKTTYLMIKDMELTDMSGMYTCQHGPFYKSIQVNNCHKTQMVRGIGDFPDVLLSGQIIEMKEYTKVELTCFSCSIPFMKSVFFYINGKLEDNVRYSDGECYHKRKLCSQTECTCTETGNDFTWIYISDLSNLEVACEMKFQLGKTPQLTKITAVLVFNGSEFTNKIISPKNITETDLITGTPVENEMNSDDCQQNTDMVYVTVSMLTMIVAMCIAVLSFAFPHIPGRIKNLISYCCFEVTYQTDNNSSLIGNGCATCFDISVCGLCVDCKKFYCDICCKFHLKEYTKHKVCQIQNVSNSRDVLCCKYCSQLAKRFCEKCWELCCGTCAKTHTHSEMMVIYPVHYKLKRQISLNIQTQLNKIKCLCINEKHEKSDPVRICGIGYLADGTIVAVDRMNYTLIIFDSNQKQLKELLNDEPCAMTTMTGNEIAITFSQAKYIRMFKINFSATKNIDIMIESNIITMHSLELPKLKPFSIAHNKGYFAVEVGEGEDGKIIIVDIARKLILKEIKCEFAYFTGHTIRLGLKVHEVNDDVHGRVFVSAMSIKRVSCLDFNSKPLWHISIPSPRSIIVPEDNSLDETIMLSSRRCNAIYQLNETDGKERILLSGDQVKSPRYIAYHSSTNRVCVLVRGKTKEDELAVFEFKDPKKFDSTCLLIDEKNEETGF